MTSPAKLHIIPNCGLEIIPRLSEDDNGHLMSHNRNTRCSISLREYESSGVKNGKRSLSYMIEDIETQGFPVALDNSRINGRRNTDFSGVMSPLSPLSLPKQRKKQAGIDARATRYAYIHPPRGLAGALDWAAMKVVWKQLKYHDRKINSSDDGNESEALIVPPSQSLLKKWALACFSLLGAFVYFQDKDDMVEVISVNALCLSKLGTKGVLRMEGPFKTPLGTIQVLKKLNRFEVIPLENFHECGFVAKAWICPKEFGSSNGSMVFLRDDNTGLTYNIKSGADALRSGSRSILADLIDPYELDFKMIIGQKFVTEYVTCNDGEGCKRRFLQHFPYWSPLHYSCRFKTMDIESIRTSKIKYADSVGNLDRFNRSVLHLACESMTVTGEVIRELLDNKDDTITNRLLYCTTKCCKRLPLHIAINSGAPKEVIEELLEKSKMRRTYLERTSDGRLPIHIAIERMADKSVIELLLNVDSEKETLYEAFKGMLPLHIACWNGHFDAVKLILDSDEQGMSIHHNLTTSFYLKFKSKNDYMTFNDKNEAVIISPKQKLAKKPSRFYKLGSSQNLKAYDDSNETPWVRALHIALLRCPDDNSARITKLLLQGEYWDIDNEEGEVTVTMTDSIGRNPLMLACMQNAEEEIIKSLINLDPTKITAAQVDKRGDTALHHLCEHKTVRASTVQLLLDAEDEYYSSSRSKAPRIALNLSVVQRLQSFIGSFDDDDSLPTQIEKSTSTLNKQKMTPLKLAIRAGASTPVLQLLLQTDRIDMRDFDDQIIHQLSLRVSKSSILQESIIDKLSARHPCFILIMSVVQKVAIFAFFVKEADDYIKGSGSAMNGSIAIPLLLAYSVLEIIKEINELISFGARYFLSEKNCLDNCRIVLVTYSITAFIRRKGTSDTSIGFEAQVVVVACLLLGIDIILSLRSTFLPFAKFAGGLTAILFTLVPFFIVSTILMVCFIVAFRVDAFRVDASRYDNNDVTTSEAQMCREGFIPCTGMVFKAFFTGEFESEGTIYLLFGFAIILILLTIIIAIVSDAWDAVENKATEYYWESRITFLHESKSSIFELKRQSYVKKKIIDFGTTIADWIDEFGFVGVFQDEKKFSWTRDSPYNQVSDIHQYYKPFDYFHPSVAEVIKQARSFQSDMYWISQKQEGFERKKSMTINTIRWFGYYVMYCFLFILGVPSGGFFWPRGLRRSILSYGYDTSMESQSEKQSEGGESSQKELKHTTSDIDDQMIPKKSNTEMFEDFFVHIMGISPESAQKIDAKTKLQMIGDKIGVKMKHECKGGYY